MGHLINPIAFRLNYFKSWEDSWFVKNIYYPEYLNGMLKLRNYLYFFLTEKRILKSGIFLSNFFILKYNKIYVINIYIYHIDFEKLSFESVNRLYTSFFSYNRNKKIRKVSNFFKLFVSNIDIFFFLIFFYKIFYKKKKKKKKKKLFFETNLFFKSNDFKDYYKNLLTKSNALIIDKFFNLNFFKNKELELEKLEKLELEKIDNLQLVQQVEVEKLEDEELAKLREEKSDKMYEYNMLNNYNSFILKNKKYKEYEYKTSKLKLKLNNYENKNIYLKFNFTLFEFIIFLLKKIGFNFKSKIFDKILKLKCVISFLCVFKYLNYKFKKIKIKYNFLLFFLVFLLKAVLMNVSKNNIKNNMRNKVYFLLYNYLGYKFFFKEFKIIISFLNNIFFILNNIKNISYKFFFLSNKNITARWLCRYIGIKLKNNYSFYSVINPIKKELYKLCKLNKKKNYNKLYSFNNLVKQNNLKYKFKFKSLIKDFFYIYIKENFLYYINNNNYIYDLYIYFSNKENKNISLYSFIKKYKYIYINIFINFYWELNLLKKQKILDNIIYRIYNFILINFDNKFSIELKKFYISTFFLNNLLKFNYFKYIWLQIKKFNARNIRNSNIIKYSSMLIGYKLAFKGRFSRKQRASNIWYMHGKVPLNTLSVKLDYFFFTIPLKNSAISIKIILYKSLYNEKFKYLLIY